MDNREIKAMMAELAPVIREFAAKAIEPLQAEIAELRKELAARPAPQNGQDGKSVTAEDVSPLILAEVAKAVAAIPAPKDGQDGKSITIDDIAPLISSEVAKAVDAIPVPSDGQAGKDGRDGVGLAGAMIGRAGDLVVTLTNGEVKSLGPIVGKDGEPGADGSDGLGFEDMSEEIADDGRTIIRRYIRGDQVKEFRHRISTVLDRGVFKEGHAYEPGDGVTWAGSFWIAQKETSAKPEGGDGWRLAVKRGRDGKDGVMKPAADPKPVKVF